MDSILLFKIYVRFFAGVIGFFAIITCANALETPADQAVSERFEQYCSRCHIKGQARAPLVSDDDQWLKRWQAQGRAGFLNSLVKGKGRMPKQGGCFECSGSDFEDLIDYLIDLKGF